MDIAKLDDDLLGMKTTPPKKARSKQPDARKNTPQTRVVLSLEDRVEVILQRHKGLSERKIAQMFNCGKTQISSILKNEAEILKDFRGYKSLGLKRKRKEKFTEINDKVLMWVNRAKEEGLPISGTVLKEKALEFARALGIEEFHASNGWLDSFRTRHSLSFKSTVPSKVESIVVEPSVDFLCDEWNSLMTSLTDTYSDRDIFSMSETALYLKTLPSKSMFLNDIEHSNDKTNKEWVTLCLCASAAGEKRNPWIISKSNISVTCKNEQPDVSGACPNIVHHPTACMTPKLFREWLENFNTELVQENRKVALILDDASCHFDHVFSNVELFALHNDETFKCQPLREGVISSFKTEYRKRFLRYVVARMTEYTSAAELADSVTMDKAKLWISDAWDNVTVSSIKFCFSCCRLTKCPPPSCYGITTEIAENAVKTLSQLAHIEFDAEAANADDLIECYDVDKNDDPRALCIFDSSSSFCSNADKKKMSVQQTLLEVERLAKLFDADNCEGGQNIRLHFQGLIDNLEVSVVKKKYLNLK